MIREDKREQERRKRRRRKQKQAQLKHARRGVISCVLCGVSLAALLLLLTVAYKSMGEAASYIGGIGMIAAVCAGYGMYMGIRGLKERKKLYITCKIGIGTSSVLLLIFLGIFCRGAF